MRNRELNNETKKKTKNASVINGEWLIKTNI